MTDDELLLEIDYTGYDNSCRDPHITPAADLVECRRLRGHGGEPHGTRAGVRAIRWSVEPTPLAA